MRSTYEKIVKDTKGQVIPKALKLAPKDPGPFAYVVPWFGEIMESSEFSHSELRHWSYNNGITLTPDEVKLLGMINRIYRSVNSDGYSPPTS